MMKHRSIINKGIAIGMLSISLLCAACGNNNYSSPETPNIETEEEMTYELSVYDGYVAIFADGSEDPYLISNVAISDLSPEDAAMIGGGVPAADLEEAKELLAGYQAPEEDEGYAALARAFPRTWTGTFAGLSSDGSKKDTNLQITFREVNEDGFVTGVCQIGFDGTHWYDRTGSYYFEGYIDWEDKTIEIWGTEWADQQVLEIMRKYTGKFDDDFQLIDGSCETTRGTSISTWHMLAD